MSARLLVVVFSVTAVVMLGPAPVAGQSAEPETPLTPWGDPDLQGVWDFRTIIPLERPDERAGQAFLTDEEAAQIEQEALEEDERLNAPSEVDRPPLPAGEGTGAYNNFWLDWGTNVLENRRTSLIVDPPNGKLPPLQPGIRRQQGVDPRMVTTCGGCVRCGSGWAVALTALKTGVSQNGVCSGSTAARP